MFIPPDFAKFLGNIPKLYFNSGVKFWSCGGVPNLHHRGHPSTALRASRGTQRKN
jgi:hypothetical protein